MRQQPETSRRAICRAAWCLFSRMVFLHFACPFFVSLSQVLTCCPQVGPLGREVVPLCVAIGEALELRFFVNLLLLIIALHYVFIYLFIALAVVVTSWNNYKK